MSTSHVGDIGTSFQITVTDEADAILDISSATAMSILFRKPDFSGVEKVGVHLTDGLDGIVSYTSIADDLDQQGPWSIQAKVTLPTGTWYSAIGEFTVDGNLV